MSLFAEAFVVCEDVCSTCPWREENGHQLIQEQIKQIVESGMITPCHQKLEEVTGSPYTGVEEYAIQVDRFMVCKGLVSAMQKSVPAPNGAWDFLYKYNDLGYHDDDPTLVDIQEVLNGNIGH